MIIHIINNCNSNITHGSSLSHISTAAQFLRRVHKRCLQHCNLRIQHVQLAARRSLMRPTVAGLQPLCLAVAAAVVVTVAAAAAVVVAVLRSTALGRASSVCGGAKRRVKVHIGRVRRTQQTYHHHCAFAARRCHCAARPASSYRRLEIFFARV